MLSFICIFPPKMRFYLSVPIQNFGRGSGYSEQIIFSFHKSLLSDFWIVIFLISRDRFLFLKFRIIFTSYSTLKHIVIICSFAK